jgi:hypothetical protein
LSSIQAEGQILNLSSGIVEGIGVLFARIAILLAMAVGPFVVFAVIVHFLEHAMQRRLAQRFGWKSVLWTGWLGTPIHELSHAAMCILFRHRIDELVLFEPDRQSGRLGYVRHWYRRGNWFEEIGNVFIGIAPLMGGSLALALLLWMFYPGAFHGDAAVSDSRISGVITATIATARSIVIDVLQWSHFGTVRFWVFLYLVLCVGSHMAPSASDYSGAGRGAIILGLLLIVILFVIAVTVGDLDQLAISIVEILSPVFALLTLTVVLCSVATLAVTILLDVVPKLWGR